MSKQNTNQTYMGFTIIEVVLVLAIAGLIFLMVFIALPSLQRNQRDTQRRNDMSRLLTAVQNYQTNNNGNVPTFNTAFITNYLKVGGDSFTDPSGMDYSFVDTTACTSSTCAQKSTTTEAGQGKIHVYTNATCNGESPKYIAGARKVAFTIKLEGAGIYCGNN